MCYNNYSKGSAKMKKDKRERKMTPEQLQQLLHMRNEHLFKRMAKPIIASKNIKIERKDNNEIKT